MPIGVIGIAIVTAWLAWPTTVNQLSLVKPVSGFFLKSYRVIAGICTPILILVVMLKGLGRLLSPFDYSNKFPAVRPPDANGGQKAQDRSPTQCLKTKPPQAGAPASASFLQAQARPSASAPSGSSRTWRARTAAPSSCCPTSSSSSPSASRRQAELRVMPGREGPMASLTKVCGRGWGFFGGVGVFTVFLILCLLRARAVVHHVMSNAVIGRGLISDPELLGTHFGALSPTVR